jgi:hypothetical protein
LWTTDHRRQRRVAAVISLRVHLLDDAGVRLDSCRLYSNLQTSSGQSGVDRLLWLFESGRRRRMLAAAAVANNVSAEITPCQHQESRASLGV